MIVSAFSNGALWSDSKISLTVPRLLRGKCRQGWVKVTLGMAALEARLTKTTELPAGDYSP